MNWHKLKVIQLSKPIDNATTLTFDLPESLYNTFNFQPGQHLVIKFNVNNKEVRRSYSLNSSPFINEPLQVTVKRVKGGLVSNYVNDKLKVGEVLEVMAPQGRFYANINKEGYKTYFLFAAGSGITPIFSILKSVLVGSPNSLVHLFYGNQNQDTILFKDELVQLQNQFPDRLNVVNTLSDPKVWSTWKQYKGRKGRIDPADVEWFITENPPIAQSTEYYICGPGAMNTSVRTKLLELGIPGKLVHIEQFGGEIADSQKEIDAQDNALLSARIHGRQIEAKVPKGKTILQVLKELKADPPYSCESGICATCIAKVKKGSAEMKVRMALEDPEIKEGYILTCQALPTSEEIDIEFE